MMFLRQIAANCFNQNRQKHPKYVSLIKYQDSMIRCNILLPIYRLKINIQQLRKDLLFTYDVTPRWYSTPVASGCTLSGVISGHVVTNDAIIFSDRVIRCPFRCLHHRVCSIFWWSTICMNKFRIIYLSFLRYDNYLCTYICILYVM